MHPPTDSHLRCSGRIDPSLDALVTVRDALTEALHTARWTEEDAFRVLICADEAMANALTHGRSDDGPIDVRFRVSADQARVSTPDTSAEHGRGVILMRALADRLRVRPSLAGTSVGLAFRPAEVTS